MEWEKELSVDSRQPGSQRQQGGECKVHTGTERSEVSSIVRVGSAGGWVRKVLLEGQVVAQ